MGDGAADLAVGSVHGVLAASTRTGRPPKVRFAAVLHQRSPLAALVPIDSPRTTPADLAGARVVRSNAPWFDAEYRAGLEYLGLAPPVHVGPNPLGTRPSLARGEVDAVGSWEDGIAVIRERAGIPVRAIPFGPDVYTTGLLAADSVAPDVVERVVSAVAAALAALRRRPDLGVAELCARIPGVGPDRVAEEWGVLSRYLFGSVEPLVMRRDRWEATLRHAQRVQGFPPVDVARICREELLATPVPAVLS
jgi:ABC-type nitrate/sulfonate/bicarbonate transport system substrate-binding protein